MKLVRRPLEQQALTFLLGMNIPQSEWEDPRLDLAGTPARLARMYREELLSSYLPGAIDDLRRRFTCFDSDGNDAMVMERDIGFTSICSHHFLEFSGVAHVAYVPGAKLIGASKIPRVVEFYSRMLQVQERMTRQIAEFIHEQADAKMVIVLTMAKHSCMRTRGVKQHNADMVTTCIRPEPGNENESEVYRAVVNEFYQQLGLKR